MTREEAARLQPGDVVEIVEKEILTGFSELLGVSPPVLATVSKDKHPYYVRLTFFDLVLLKKYGTHALARPEEIERVGPVDIKDYL